MLVHFDDDAQRTVIWAQEEARRLDHSHIGAEHLLLGVLDQKEDTAARVLAALSTDIGKARQRVAESLA